jgi:hypothetical protein
MSVSTLRFGLDPRIGLAVFAWSLTTALGVLLFAFFLRRPARRRQPVGTGRLASAAASPVLAGPGSGSGASGDDTNPDEANLPRWLRPSLREQRQWSDRQTSAAAREPERFESPARKGIDRRTIGYRLVRLSDAPDDLRSSEVGRLDRGDEVEIIGDFAGFLQVRPPSGLEGWVPRIAIVR